MSATAPAATIVVTRRPKTRYITNSGHVAVAGGEWIATVTSADGEREFVSTLKSLVVRMAKLFVKAGCDEAEFARLRGF